MCFGLGVFKPCKMAKLKQRNWELLELQGYSKGGDVHGNLSAFCHFALPSPNASSPRYCRPPWQLCINCIFFPIHMSIHTHTDCLPLLSASDEVHSMVFKRVYIHTCNDMYMYITFIRRYVHMNIVHTHVHTLHIHD